MGCASSGGGASPGSMTMSQFRTQTQNEIIERDRRRTTGEIRKSSSSLGFASESADESGMGSRRPSFSGFANEPKLNTRSDFTGNQVLPSPTCKIEAVEVNFVADLVTDLEALRKRRGGVDKKVRNRKILKYMDLADSVQPPRLPAMIESPSESYSYSSEQGGKSPSTSRNSHSFPL